MSRFTIATWNINSVRLRAGLVEQFLGQHQPDVLCLQEIKCQNDQFPAKAFERLGYAHQAVHGQKAYHGVAVIARHPLRLIETRAFCGKDDTRHIAVEVDMAGTAVRIDNLYVPAGGDVPDPDVNEKFAHKLGFLEELDAWIGGGPVADRQVVVGDLNIAPLEHDVWSHKQLLDVVSHTPIETSRFEAVRQRGQWIDVMRQIVPASEKLYTWWSYRAADWEASDRGRRLDHVWASPALGSQIAGLDVVRAARGWDKPSDHVPVIAAFAV